MPIKSAGKGKAYERKISKLLSEWCGFELIRTPMSGAWQGTSGDIKPKDVTKPFPFVVECKKQEKWCMEQLMAGDGPAIKWIDQAHAEIAKDAVHGRSAIAFMLIFTRNRKPDYIALPADLLIASTITRQLNALIIRTNSIPVIVYELNDFIKHVPYETLLALIKN